VGEFAFLTGSDPAGSRTNMLEQLFGSKTRVRLLRLFLQNPTEAFFVRELTRKIGAQINAVRNELENLLEMDVVMAAEFAAPQEVGADGMPMLAEPVKAAKAVAKKGKKKRASTARKYFKLNQESIIVGELRALFMKSQVLLEKDFVRKITEAGSVQYMALTGFFVGVEGAPTDIFIVGKMSKERAGALIRAFEREVGRELNYTIMTPQEYKYRRDVTDRFLYSILESRKIVVMDTVAERVGIPAL
jgi:hypothetical protein